MAPPTQKQVRTLTEFTAEIEDALRLSHAEYGAKYSVNWYRGIGDPEHSLVPGLFRHKTVTKVDDLLLLERDMIDWFGREGVLLPPVTRYPENDLERLFFMQHYGVPTRLLDWTGNPFIALYFALTTARRDKKGAFVSDAAVWILNPNAWNQTSLAGISWGGEGVLSLDASAISGYEPRKVDDPLGLKAMHELPVAMLGIANTTRMFAQKGVFTIFGRNKKSMEKMFDEENFPPISLKRLVIPKENVQSLLDAILLIGYTDSVSYPDLHGLAMEIKRSFGFPF